MFFSMRDKEERTGVRTGYGDVDKGWAVMVGLADGEECRLA